MKFNQQLMRFMAKTCGGGAIAPEAEQDAASGDASNGKADKGDVAKAEQDWANLENKGGETAGKPAEGHSEEHHEHFHHHDQIAVPDDSAEERETCVDKVMHYISLPWG